jgi:Na+/proline symporter
MTTYNNLKILLGLVVQQRTYLEGLSYGLLIQGENRWFQLVLTGWWFGTCFIFPIILGMSSSQLTNSIIFQRGRLNHQLDNQFSRQTNRGFFKAMMAVDLAVSQHDGLTLRRLSLLETYPVA